MISLPGSAADLPQSRALKQGEERDILAMVRGEHIYLTRKEAFALAAQLVISLEVDDDRH